ncbi:MAG TPA: c-type cytochrome [Candidatus Sulfotelmatobacter sp.]|nr:c-type cytochrome [Candidatus Sulfotelmatobacter sp.]
MRFSEFGSDRNTQRKSKAAWRMICKRMVCKLGLALVLCGAIANSMGQNSPDKKSVSSLNEGNRGKGIFEQQCAICHGIDGLGGERAPDLVRRAAVRARSDKALFDVIHEGIPQGGMPAFTEMAKEDIESVVAYLRVLQGNSAGGSKRGDPKRGDPKRGDPTRGHDLFFGKAECSTCHQIGGQEQLAGGDLREFARDSDSAEIRDAILKPAGGKQETATAISKDGRTFSGTIRNEDNFSLQLQGSDGRFYLLMKSSLDSVKRQAGTSAHVNYNQLLSATELDDLVAYILHAAGPGEVASSAEDHGKPHDPE